MTDEQKAIIDGMSLYSLLEKWRFGKVGDPLLTGDCGEYFAEVMNAKRDANPEYWTSASKALGWQRRE